MVGVINDGDLEATVHWRGLRLETSMSVSPAETQTRFRPTVTSPTGSGFPDPGLYWYHLHIREDRTREMGARDLPGRALSLPGFQVPAACGSELFGAADGDDLRAGHEAALR